jgi:hypothetical protein
MRIDLEDGIQVTHYALFTPRWQYRYAFVQTEPGAVARGFALRGDGEASRRLNR